LINASLRFKCFKDVPGIGITLKRAQKLFFFFRKWQNILPMSEAAADDHETDEPNYEHNQQGGQRSKGGINFFAHRLSRLGRL